MRKSLQKKLTGSMLVAVAAALVIVSRLSAVRHGALCRTAV